MRLWVVLRWPWLKGKRWARRFDGVMPPERWPQREKAPNLRFLNGKKSSACWVRSDGWLKTKPFCAKTHRILNELQYNPGDYCFLVASKSGLHIFLMAYSTGNPR